MNILFVLYGDFRSNSANPLALYARELHRSGHCCAIAVPSGLETVSLHENPAFRPVLYRDVLAAPESVFPDGRPADVIHACTPREVVRRFTMSYMDKRPTPLVIYLEDNEAWISTQAAGLNGTSLFRYTHRELSNRLPDTLSHPFLYGSFIGLADAVAVIQDKLRVEVPPWVHCETVMIGVDIDFFSPRPPDPELRSKYGVAQHERVIVYHGGVHRFTRPSIETLCKAVGLINRQGYPCRLLRSGLHALDFLNQMPHETASMITDIGFLPRQALPGLLALADVFVQPGGIDPFEDLRLPGKVPEFLAMGRPVVMPNTNISHLFREGRDALLLRSGTVGEIAEKCIVLFSDPQRASMIGRSGRILAEKYFDVRNQARRLEGVYNVARGNFNPEVASEIWRTKTKDIPIQLLVARKLRLMADMCDTKMIFEKSPMMREYARHIELMEQRVRNLEAEVAKRDVQIEKIISSESWKVTAPLRAVGRAFRAGSAFIGRIRYDGRLLRPYLDLAVREPRWMVRTAAKALAVLRRSGWRGIKQALVQEHVVRDYQEWISRFDSLTDAHRAEIKRLIQRFSDRPLISVVMPVFNPPPRFLDAAIQSVRQQIYPRWELCIANDASSHSAVIKVLKRHQKQDPRVKVVYRKENGHIARASNSALELAEGDFVALLNHDDALSEHALFWVVDAINRHPDAGLLFSDEDKIDEFDRRYAAYFKCEFNYELFLAQNMINHLGVYRASLLREIGGFRPGFEGSQDYDLALRVIERLEPHQIVHIPRVLYHWRAIASSTALNISEKSYAVDAARNAVQEHLDREGRPGRVIPAPELPMNFNRVIFNRPDPAPPVSILIPTRDRADLLRMCIDSILQRTTYKNYEIIIIDNGSQEPSTFELFDRFPAEKVRVVRDDVPFNFSALNNRGASAASGDLLCLMNNDIEILTPDWLEEMVSFAIQPDIGCVGARLWYPDGRLQHGGVILGIGGVAGHAHYRIPRGEKGYRGRAVLHQQVSAVTGACLLVRRSIFEEVGGLDESLVVSFNDIDFCLRVRKAGYRNVWTPYAEMNHHESASRSSEDTTEKQVRFSREIRLMQQRWGEMLFCDPAYSPNLTFNSSDFAMAWPPRVSQVQIADQ